MKRNRIKNSIICLLMCLVLLCMCAGCGSGEQTGKTTGQTKSVDDVLAEGMEEADTTADDNGTNGQNENVSGAVKETDAGGDADGTEPETGQAGAAGVDVDLTSLSSTMVYSEVYNMMVTPENYMGKTVRMAGTFSRYHDDSTNMDYFACVIKDATACCAQGLEFSLTDAYSYPDDYPEEGGEICVVGTFDTYQEGENIYCRLKDAKLES